MTTKVTASVLANTAVAAGTYGGSTQHAVVTVDAQGRLTYAANATPSIANSQITGVMTASQLAATAVTTGTYGGSSAIPVIVVDQQGRLTSAANASISIPPSTSIFANSGQLTANSATGNVAIGLATTSAIAGSYGSGTQTPVITVDAYGRITSVSATTITGGSAGIGATTFNRQSNTATAGQTVFTVNGGYTVGYLQVYHNGVLLNATDYTASNGTSFTLAVAAYVGDIVESFAYTVTNVLNVSPSPSGGSAGQVLYQSAANTTANTDVGTAGYLLTSQGTGKPTWSAQSALTIATSQLTGTISAAQLASTAVTAGTYGSSANSVTMTIDAQGRITSAANTYIASAGGVVYENNKTITANYTMGTNKNGTSAGPITINSGVTVTIPAGSRWVVS
jgi:hypothetical protein